MLQVQFLLTDLDESEEIDSDLEFIGVAHDDVHFMSDDHQAIVDHHLQPANVFEERNLLQSLYRGAIFGTFIGVTASFFAILLQPFGWLPQIYNIVLITLLCVAFGSWLGGMVGLGQKNYKISKFNQYLIAGKTLLMVYLKPTDMQKVLSMMSKKHPSAKYLTTNPALDNPFEKTKAVQYE